MKRDKSKRWFLYVVECSDKSLYTGITTDIDRRIDEHNHSKKGAKYTASRRPVQIVFARIFENQSTATKAECQFKKFRRKEKLKIISGEKEFPLVNE